MTFCSVQELVTPIKVLPPMGRKMRCFGASAVYTTGAVFAFPEHPSSDAESEAARDGHANLVLACGLFGRDGIQC
jgi:hypothetical protein